MSINQPHILFAAGGTGGHVFPALAIADEIKKMLPSARILFVGTKGKIEARVVPERGYDFTTIWISGFHRGLRAENLIFPLKIAVALMQSFVLIQRFRPDVVVGTGGYVCGPVMYEASLLGLPTVVHESNSYPGVTTRMLSKRATNVLTAFASTKRWLKRQDNVELVGTPTREALDGVSRESALKFFGLEESKQTILVLGGSLGASSINGAVANAQKRLADEGIQIIWQTGEKDISRLRNTAQQSTWIGGFVDKMEYAYAAADLVVSRSGATTLAELSRVGKPAILVPYPHAAADHQTTNARAMEEAGAAVLIRDAEVDARLSDEILKLLGNKTTLRTMATASKSLGRPEAGRVIAEKITNLLRT